MAPDQHLSWTRARYGHFDDRDALWPPVVGAELHRSHRGRYLCHRHACYQFSHRRQNIVAAIPLLLHAATEPEDGRNRKAHAVLSSREQVTKKLVVNEVRRKAHANMFRHVQINASAYAIEQRQIAFLVTGNDLSNQRTSEGVVWIERDGLVQPAACRAHKEGGKPQ